MPETSIEIDRGLLGESLHTALRKACDTRAAHDAWTAIAALPSESWGSYLDAVWDELTRPSLQSSAERIRQATVAWTQRHAADGDAELKLAMATSRFSVIDWDGYASFVEHYQKENHHDGNTR